MYPGESASTMWGHSALRVLDPGTKTDVVFNYAIFDEVGPWFNLSFVFNSATVRMGVYSLEQFLFPAALAKRDVEELILNLTIEDQTVLWQALVADRSNGDLAYLYDFIQDNCATRLWDHLVTLDSFVPPDVIPPTSLREIPQFQ